MHIICTHPITSLSASPSPHSTLTRVRCSCRLLPTVQHFLKHYKHGMVACLSFFFKHMCHVLLDCVVLLVNMLFCWSTHMSSIPQQSHTNSPIPSANHTDTPTPHHTPRTGWQRFSVAAVVVGGVKGRPLGTLSKCSGCFWTVTRTASSTWGNLLVLPVTLYDGGDGVRVMYG